MKNKEIKNQLKKEFQDIHMPSRKEQLMRDIEYIDQLEVQQIKISNQFFSFSVYSYFCFYDIKTSKCLFRFF